MTEIDVTLYGLTALPEPTGDERQRLVTVVCAELAAGSDITDACAIAQVAPARYLAWTVDDTQIATAHARALKIRARLLADAPIAAARALKHARTTGETGGHKLGEVVAALKAEVELVENVSQRGDPVVPEVAKSEHSVRITFDPLPPALAHAVTDASSVAPAPGQSALTDAVPASYVVLAPTHDDADGANVTADVTTDAETGASGQG